ncbi:NADH-quinone oxidoreductase subunit L [Sphaerisporangium melleum]|uniref:NADH-quinone oxidoreductase subunit L n=1 Tax=Sphaerisporangium melleum TaxID=321316 RepID=A0A917RBT4_9ACTN|nr:NADH-quinone oxidoreductase subunit L [Sphaerisporangium melleum]GGK99606.1 NADH-quinone oxidoreductase subunit L [Sphaerisporangium melleum]GII73615.1 NADH-quinone oxidoreductase subunit L [Sphaerisporangium melleum]
METAAEIVQHSGGVIGLSWLTIALPLLGAAILLLGGRRTDRWGHLLGVAMSLASFVVAVIVFFELLGFGADERRRVVELYDFLPGGTLDVKMGLLLDPLSISFVLLITGVGSLIHIYSIGYMAHDPNRRRFFAYLNLFVAAMLLLVLADNYLGLYVGWEGVGLASYLLIGFWQHKPSAAAAAKKAFIVNRVGDMGLALGIFVIFTTFGTIAYGPVLANASQASQGTLTLIGLALLLGACGKSAQLPLQSWLLDAMEGPTPVSALIHAATMVTAGVYLVVRSGPIYIGAPTAALVVTIVGVATLLAGAIIGTAKDDIKKALAGSTMSQIGYMMLAAGLGPVGYAFAIAHLIAHGFFKASMFLGAGSVMHAMNDEVDMRKFGGLAPKMRITWATFGLGYLAIIGFPLLSGYWTKDGIIEATMEHSPILGWLAVIGAGITGFYMSRLFFMTFHGKPRWEKDAHPHESPAVMTWPLILLSIGSVFGGAFLIMGNRFMEFLAPAVGRPKELPHFAPFSVAGVATLAVVAVGVAYAWLKYGRAEVPAVAPRGSFLTVFARRDLYGDAINEALFMRPGQWLTRLAVFFDNRGVDGLVNGLAALIGGTSGRLRRVQTGFVRSYAMSIFLGAALLVGAWFVVGNL